MGQEPCMRKQEPGEKMENVFSYLLEECLGKSFSLQQSVNTAWLKHCQWTIFIQSN